MGSREPLKKKRTMNVNSILELLRVYILHVKSVYFQNV